MSFNSLNQILNAVKQQPEWELYRQYCHLWQCWQQVVAPQVAENSRPLSISRSVLWVATSSSVWAQTLSLQRYQLLPKLNAQLSQPLQDIRFSSAQWHDRPPPLAAPDRHPSHIEVPAEVLALTNSLEETSLESAFGRWTEAAQARSRHLPLCPQCQCPTPPGELDRWRACAYCAAKQWSTTHLANPDAAWWQANGSTLNKS